MPVHFLIRLLSVSLLQALRVLELSVCMNTVMITEEVGEVPI